jgi:hypothetical protein
VPQEPGKPKRKLPERDDALKIDLPFEEAVKAALEAKAPKQPARVKRRTKRS